MDSIGYNITAGISNKDEAFYKIGGALSEFTQWLRRKSSCETAACSTWNIHLLTQTKTP
jgi:hypothetical protein